MLKLKIDLSKNIAQKPMPTLEISKHQLYFKETVISVESWEWQPHQELSQGKTVQILHLFPLPSLISTFF